MSFEDATTRKPALKRTIVSLHEELYNLQMGALQHVIAAASIFSGPTGDELARPLGTGIAMRPSDRDRLW